MINIKPLKNEDYETNSICRVCHRKFTVLIDGKNRIFYSCRCEDSHTRFLLYRKIWLIWDVKKPIMHNNVMVGKGDWRIATPEDNPPVIRSPFIFR